MAKRGKKSDVVFWGVEKKKQCEQKERQLYKKKGQHKNVAKKKRGTSYGLKEKWYKD